MIVWDHGPWTPMAIRIEDMRRGISNSNWQGSGSTAGGTSCACGEARESKEQWLLIKSDDEYAKPKMNRRSYRSN